MMARRFGRNQKRRLREEIATLEKALWGGWRRASDARVAFTIPNDAVRSFSDETAGDRERGVDRRCRLTLYDAATEQLCAALYESGKYDVLVAYRGLAWRVDQVSVPMVGNRHFINENREVEVVLIATSTERMV